MDKIVFFGAGAHARNLWNRISQSPFFSDQYIAFSDNDRKLWGKEFEAIKIIPPADLIKIEADAFVITSTYEKEIERQMKVDLGIPSEKIFSFNDYQRKCYTKWKYNQKYSDVDANTDKKTGFDIDNVVVYTAITGGYDNLADPLFTDEKITYVCFTDDRNLKSNIWNIEYIHDNKLDAMHLAKKIKIFPHIYVKEFETSVWVDGITEIQSDIREYIRKYEKTMPILCFPHSERNCVYEEAAACLYLKKGEKTAILKQIFDYYQKGYPMNNGLYEMGCIVRQHNDEMVQKIMKDWAEEIERYSYRDQLSFPIVCERNGFLPDICDLNFWRNKWLKQQEHSSH